MKYIKKVASWQPFRFILWLTGVNTHRLFDYVDWTPPSRAELYANPVQTISVTPDWYDVQQAVSAFMIELLRGYEWACKYDENMVAVHDELGEVERVLHALSHLRYAEERDEWIPTADEEFALLLVDFARLVPKMWD